MLRFGPIVLVAALLPVSGCSRDAPSAATPPTKAAVNGEVAIRHEIITRQEGNMSPEGQARRDRSLVILKTEKVPFIEHLPLVEAEAESTRRTTEEVATRAMALCIVAVKGEGLEQEIVDQVVSEYQLESAFTPKELAFIRNPNPSRHDRVQFAWRYEDYWVMLWALGFIDKLERPDKVCDVPRAAAILRDLGRDKFLEKARLRPQAELLDAADLIYRYHWSVVDARLKKAEAPAGLDGGVVLERHYALNWLIGCADADWDDVPTDT